MVRLNVEKLNRYKTAFIREQESTAKRLTLNRDYSVDYKVKIPANGYTWLVIE